MRNLLKFIHNLKRRAKMLLPREARKRNKRTYQIPRYLLDKMYILVEKGAIHDYTTLIVDLLIEYINKYEKRHGNLGYTEEFKEKYLK